MDFFNRVLVVAFFIVSSSMATNLVYAQSQMTVKFRDMDQNGDRNVSRSEWEKYSQMVFDRYDSNKNGVLSHNEVRDMAMETRWDQESNSWDDSNGNGNTNVNHWRNRAEVAFVRFDKSRDGLVSRNEWQGTIAVFVQLDDNRDGVLSRSEFFNHQEVWVGAPLEIFSSDPFRAMDRNNDNLIIRNEWNGSYWEFDNLDADNSNSLSIEEFHEPTSPDVFRALDHDNNSVLSHEEWHYTAQSFAALDRNNNGTLDRDEFYNRAQVRVAVFSELDINNDRVVSRNEWRADTVAFNSLDVNRDGGLSENEFYSQNSSDSGTSPQQIMEQLFQQIFKNR